MAPLFAESSFDIRDARQLKITSLTLSLPVVLIIDLDILMAEDAVQRGGNTVSYQMTRVVKI
jgi:hypothetical protein